MPIASLETDGAASASRRAGESLATLIENAGGSASLTISAVSFVVPDEAQRKSVPHILPPFHPYIALFNHISPLGGERCPDHLRYLVRRAG